MTFRLRTIHVTAAFAATALALLALATAASAATYTVDSTLDTVLAPLSNCVTPTSDSDCTLRGAITRANADVTADTIIFGSGGTGAIVIGTPLPALTTAVTIDARSASPPVTVVGSGGYLPACSPSPAFALGMLSPLSLVQSVRGLPISAVCGKAIQSASLAAPAVRVGPRRGDGTLPVTATGGGSDADFFLNAATLDNEATEYKISAPVVSGVATYFPPEPITAGTKFTATITSDQTTSGFAARASVPVDITSPLVTKAVAVSESRVRLDFNEPIAQDSLSAADFSVAMGTKTRTVGAVTAFANSVFIDVTDPWQTGEAGSIQIATVGAVTDSAGNEILGVPALKVYPASGDFSPPVITKMTISPSKMCRKKTRSCKHTQVTARIVLSERSRVTITILRGAANPKRILSFKKKLEAGVNLVKLNNVIVGRKLTKGLMTVDVLPEDVARTLGASAQAYFAVK
ncbi:MAG: Ig-like domain-containing protein [Thermoleophilaceae bacterium]|nr:Ig-like domain-containing protein [Thermoleophilaceae bacterium]